MKAVRIQKTGGPEVLEVADVDLPEPGAGEIRVRHEAVGLNFIDVYQRKGLYPLKLPVTLGQEAAGVVDAVGEGVTRFQAGDRVAYAGVQGAYAEANVVKAEKAVKLPDGVSTRDAAALMLKGLTAEFLARRTWPLQAGDTVLVHAAAGGVGSILCLWLAHLGVRVIGAVGSAEKAERAKANGCFEVLVYADGDLPPRVMALTDRQGVKVVYDSVGEATFWDSLNSLAKRGLMVSFGNASGPAPEFAPLELSKRGSLFLTRPTMFDYLAKPGELEEAARALFDVIQEGVVEADIGQTFPLAEVARAHEALEGRGTTGSTLLIP